MKTVRDLLSHKGNAVWYIHPDDTVYEAIELMAEKEIGALPVVESGKLVGIISERDYARNVFLKGKRSKETLIREIMTQNVVYVDPNRTVDECMAIMTTRRVRHLPVLVDGRIKGLISIGDVVRATIDDQEFLIDQLENYIMGRA